MWSLMNDFHKLNSEFLAWSCFSAILILGITIGLIIAFFITAYKK